MSGFLSGILGLNPFLALAIVGLLVFAEDALFVGFVIPGETAAVLGGVLASRGHVDLWAMMALVVLAAIVGDAVGYGLGKRFGPRIVNSKVLDRRRAKLRNAQDFLHRHGGYAVFFGRFLAFFRALMPTLAGTSRMHYPRFLVFNAAGGLVWGVCFVLLGYLAGNSYEAVARVVGTGVTAAVVVITLAALAVWRILRMRQGRRRTAPEA
ncbi:DedA family protein [Arthrobacter sp. I2-34]|uniref:DedA family protein n=1 Tax=Arthrobacter hankyongi TaxID=2904801 RepID=A0ABS9L727_9MICC|nr:DedA family protein [Arthrobacter hankyongi]MCG2622297.1 DedA family protein [Arthrobacter hankyongi]